MSVFPQFGIINENVLETIKSRTGDNTIAVSSLIPWIRISSAVDKGMILESMNSKSDFKSEYGGEQQSGKIGRDFSGTAIHVDNDRSYRPAPLIDALSIENGTQGLSRKAKFTIKCFTLGQANALTKYFYEPGFVVLIEFGWNTKDSVSQKANLTPKGGACEIAKYNNYTHVLNKRSASKGTYDGFMGYITGGGFTSADGEVYNIDVEITTLGEIPSYLQTHKHAVNDAAAPNSTGETYSLAQIETSVNEDDGAGLGKAMFKQMFNRLPAEKQTLNVQALIDEFDMGKKNKWSSPENFIGMDDVIRKSIVGKLENHTLYVSDEQKEKSGKTGRPPTMPKGVQVVQPASFIRAELAFKILNTWSAGLEAIKPEKCEISSTYSFVINTNDTILRAHKHMFSTDITKLYIPNTQLPNFSLESVLLAIEPVESDTATAKTNSVDGCFFKNKEQYAFPSTKDYKGAKLKDVIPTNKVSETWGYLRNLYINFEFFLEVMGRPNYVAKDIYYELLNGISMAVNSHWEFELMEQPNNPVEGEESGGVNRRGNHEIIVIDKTLITDDAQLLKGKHVDSKNDAGANADDAYVFSSFGKNSPFLSSKVDMSIPATMRNSILAKRAEVQANAVSEGPVLDQHQWTEFFSDTHDPVMKIFDSIRKIRKENKVNEIESFEERKQRLSDKWEKERADADALRHKNIRKQNVELFLKKASIIIIGNDRNKADIYNEVLDLASGNNASISDMLLVGAWKDTAELKKMELDEVKSDNPNPILLGIEFAFELHGISGLKIGDIFKLSDIPGKIKNGTFQIMTTSHSLTGKMWLTSGTAIMRNM